MKLHAVALSFSLVLMACGGTTRMSERATSGTSNVEAYPVEHLAIRSLIERFSDATNHQEWAVLDGLFTEDAVWELAGPSGWRFEGLAAIKAGLEGNVGKVEILVQTLSPTVIHVESPERAVARSTLSEIIRFKERGATMHIVGTYSDTLVKKSGQWRFARRTFDLRFEDDVALPERINNTPPPRFGPPG